MEQTEQVRWGQQLKERAQIQGITQESLGERMGVERSVVSKVWRGVYRKPTHYVRMAEVLETSLTHHDEPPTQGAQIITIASRKGGTAKTTTAVHVAGGLADLGHRVLLLDLDAQRDATLWLAADDADLDLTVEQVLLREATVEQATSPTVLENLDLVPASERLHLLDRALVGVPATERRLLRALESARQTYDYIVFDCPAEMDVRIQNALMVSDWLLIPTQPSSQDIMGMFNFIPQLLAFAQDPDLNPRLRLLGILMCRTRENGVLDREFRELIREHYGDQLCRTQIREYTSFKSCMSFRELIYTHDPERARDYRGAVQELLVRMEAAIAQEARA